MFQRANWTIANWANCLFFCHFLGSKCHRNMKKQQENALLSLVYDMLKMGKVARKFQFDRKFQVVNLTSVIEMPFFFCLATV